MPQSSTAPSLCLIAPAQPGADHAARVAAVLDAVKAPTLILTAPDAGAIDAAATRALISMAQGKEIAVLIADDVQAALQTEADGVHLSWRPEIEDAYEAARAKLGPEAIIGADAGTSRHDAMTLGESGADYVAFSLMTETEGEETALSLRSELIAWWSEVFVVPVVAFGVVSPSEAGALARDGADFIALRFPPTSESDNAAAWAQSFVAAVNAPETAS